LLRDLLEAFAALSSCVTAISHFAFPSLSPPIARTHPASKDDGAET